MKQQDSPIITITQLYSSYIQYLFSIPYKRNGKSENIYQTRDIFRLMLE